VVRRRRTLFMLWPFRLMLLLALRLWGSILGEEEEEQQQQVLVVVREERKGRWKWHHGVVLAMGGRVGGSQIWSLLSKTLVSLCPMPYAL